MMFHRWHKLNKNQAGFTLIEFVMALAVTAIISGIITTTLLQVITGSSRTNNHMIVIRQVQEAGFEVSRDVQQAQAVNPTPAPDADGFPLELEWTEWSGDTYHITYSLEDMSGGIPEKDLQRVEVKNEGSVDEETRSVIIASFLDSLNTSCGYAGGKLTFTVTAAMGSGSAVESETRVYEIMPRPSWQ